MIIPKPGVTRRDSYHKIRQEAVITKLFQSETKCFEKFYQVLQILTDCC